MKVNQASALIIISSSYPDAGIMPKDPKTRVKVRQVGVLSFIKILNTFQKTGRGSVVSCKSIIAPPFVCLTSFLLHGRVLFFVLPMLVANNIFSRWQSFSLFFVANNTFCFLGGRTYLQWDPAGSKPQCSSGFLIIDI